MNSLMIEKTKTTPQINFNQASGQLEIVGDSYPENAMQFYKPVFDWLADYLANSQNDLVFNFKLEYFNTSSSKCLLNIMEMLEEAFKQGRKIELNWYYSKNDEDMLESGQEFAEDMAIPFQFHSF